MAIQGKTMVIGHAKHSVLSVSKCYVSPTWELDSVIGNQMARFIFSWFWTIDMYSGEHGLWTLYCHQAKLEKLCLLSSYHTATRQAPSSPLSHYRNVYEESRSTMYLQAGRTATPTRTIQWCPARFIALAPSLGTAVHGLQFPHLQDIQHMEQKKKSLTRFSNVYKSHLYPWDVYRSSPWMDSGRGPRQLCVPLILPLRQGNSFR